MAQTTVNIRLDDTLKRQFEDFCSETGLNVSSAINIFIKTVVREQRIPFSIELDPFYSKENMAYLSKIAEEIKTGKANLQEHELLED